MRNGAWPDGSACIDRVMGAPMIACEQDARCRAPAVAARVTTMMARRNPRPPVMPNPLKRFRLVDDHKVDLASFDPAATVLDVGDRDAAKKRLKDLQGEIASWQNRLFAEHRRSLLVVLQGMDTSGKDGTTIAVFDETHPQGLHVTPFKAPSVDEADHDFLWRVHPHAPGKGMIAVFNRSHYEAVIAERVLGLADAAECRRRYAQIVDFERLLVEHGTTVVKLFLHISPEEQKLRLQSRLDEPDKHWKFNRNDLVERRRWDANRDGVRGRDPAYGDEGRAVVDRAGGFEDASQPDGGDDRARRAREARSAVPAARRRGSRDRRRLSPARADPTRRGVATKALSARRGRVRLTPRRRFD